MAGSSSDSARSAWERMDEGERQAAFGLAARYVDFLNMAKTEREATETIIEAARGRGYVELRRDSTVVAGARFCAQRKGKLSALLMVGKEPLEKGFNIVAAHVDAPRLDLKPRPLYESEGLALLRTHYYGGIKKYQWTALPMSLRGVVIKKDGSCIRVTVGDGPGDPVLTISDLLPHLAREQMEKKMSEGVTGEGLNLLVGNIPLAGATKDAVRAAVLGLLRDRYGIEEDDFCSAELEAVPAFPAVDVGLDRSMVGGYGQDDRVSAFACLEAILSLEETRRTAIAVFADKEEIGSAGNTGLRSYFLDNLVAQLFAAAGITNYFEVRAALEASQALSADVNAAFDPLYENVFEKMNASYLGAGVVLTKYTGSRGKYEASDANPEFVARVRRILDENGVVWQAGELGKVDEGGGGTVAQYLARYGMDVLDCGVPLLSMHSPFEVVSKADLFMAFKAYRAFLLD